MEKEVFVIIDKGSGRFWNPPDCGARRHMGAWTDNAVFVWHGEQDAASAAMLAAHDVREGARLAVVSRDWVALRAGLLREWCKVYMDVLGLTEEDAMGLVEAAAHDVERELGICMEVHDA